ncbi:UNVERIFIED_CONTAM: Costunolide synthase [Sesamum angustifolium]|uniref:Costunolide synthase n=1 Tax=Sesamum angustifolium TaxID=2727405 RepID=A0AAW2LU29_9LAMI
MEEVERQERTGKPPTRPAKVTDNRPRTPPRTTPFPLFQNLAKTYGDIMHFKLGEVSTIVISSPAIAKEALKTRDPMFADRPESVAAKIMWYDYVDIV